MNGTFRLALIALIVLGTAIAAAMAADSPAESDSTQTSQGNEASLSVETVEVKT